MLLNLRPSHLTLYWIHKGKKALRKIETQRDVRQKLDKNVSSKEKVE